MRKPPRLWLLPGFNPTSLRSQLLGLMTAVLLGLLCTLSGALILILLRSFSALEAKLVEDNVQRVKFALNDEISIMGQTAGDWAAWDDTYAFIQGQHPNYITENFSTDTLKILDINWIVLANLKDQVVFQKNNLDPDKNHDVTALFQDIKILPSALLYSPNYESIKSGWVWINQDLIYFVKRPIINSQRDRPHQGIMLMGRALDQERLQDLADRTKFNLKIYPLQAEELLSPRLHTISQKLISHPQKIVTQPLDHHWIAGYSLMEDTQNHPLFLLEVKTDRLIYRQGQWSLGILLAAFIVSVLAFLAIMIVLIDRYFMNRLLSLIETVTSIGRHQDLSARISLLGEDELARLAQEINQMLTQLESKEKELAQEREKSEILLLNILPSSIVQELKLGKKIIVDHFPDTSILFADIVGFTQLSTQMPPVELLEILNQIFSTFDYLTQHYGLEKIKTIGDAYMVVGGVPRSMPNHAEAIAHLALEMQTTMANLSLNQTHPFQIRIGINSGPVVAGVIGVSKFAYDIWGDAVNLASRMESSGEPGKIQVTESTYQRLQEGFELHERGRILIKGKGELTTYWLTGCTWSVPH